MTSPNFSAEIVRNDHVGPDSSASPAANSRTANTVAGTSSSNYPSPKGWTYSGVATSVCFQNVESDLTNSNGDHYELDSSFAVDSYGNHATYTSDDGISYGIIFMRLVDPASNPLLYVGQYQAFFLASQQDANTIAADACSGGNAVVYNGLPGGTSQANGTTTSNGFPYQVNVVEAYPGQSTDGPQLLSPNPTGTTNLCPPPLPSNNN
jgi:hypothetical protein